MAHLQIGQGDRCSRGVCGYDMTADAPWLAVPADRWCLRSARGLVACADETPNHTAPVSANTRRSWPRRFQRADVMDARRWRVDARGVRVVGWRADADGGPESRRAAGHRRHRDDTISYQRDLVRKRDRRRD